MGIYDLTQDGKCPNCNRQIKVVTSSYEIYKVRFLKKLFIDGEKIGKCPKCKALIKVNI